MGNCSLLANKRVGSGKFYRDSQGLGLAGRKEAGIWEELDFSLSLAIGHT